MVFVTLKKAFFEHDKAAKDLHCYVDKVFEFAMEMEVIEDNPCPPKKEIHQATAPSRTVWNDLCESPSRTLPIHHG